MALEWHSETAATLNGVPVKFVDSNYATHKTTADQIIVLKRKAFFAQYQPLCDGLSRDRINLVELGIFEGGSTLIFAEQFPQMRIAAFDLRSENPVLTRHLTAMGFADRIRMHYNTSQSDEAALVAGIAASFGTEPLHMVIDDASHHYGFTRDSFEILFPRLIAGGKYVIEDWAWPHWPGKTYDGWDGIALSALVMDLTMAMGSVQGLFQSIEVFPDVVIVTKGDATPPQRMSLAQITKTEPRVWRPLQSRSWRQRWNFLTGR